MSGWNHEDVLGRFCAHLQAVAARTDGSAFVGLDGRSGVGKSTLAAATQQQLGSADPRLTVTVIEGDQFYGGGSAATWDDRSAADKVAEAMDWRRQLAVLEALRSTGTAEWRSFDWDAADWDTPNSPLSAEISTCRATEVVILEGAYSCRPELHGQLDSTVLLDPPRPLRRQQLLAREGEAYRADWEGRWSEAEDLYFGSIMGPDRFDLVLGG